jgi:hypothetical protein
MKGAEPGVRAADDANEVEKGKESPPCLPVRVQHERGRGQEVFAHQPEAATPPHLAQIRAQDIDLP